LEEEDEHERPEELEADDGEEKPSFSFDRQDSADSTLESVSLDGRDDDICEVDEEEDEEVPAASPSVSVI
jgi:hypothetical protein